MHTSTTYTLPSLPSLSLHKPRVARSPYPIARGPAVSVAPARKAYRQLKYMLSGLKLTRSDKGTSQEAAVAAATHCDEERVPSDRLALGHDGITRVSRRETAPTCVPGSQLAPGHVTFVLDEPRETTVHADEYHGWAQVAKTSARFLSTLLECPETLPPTDATDAHPDLAHFISFALDQSRLPLCVHQYALHLIWRVSCLNPDFRPKHAHGTYLTALMLAAKQSHDIEYTVNCWAAIGQHIFEASQLRYNEWRMCERLGWRLLVHPTDLVKLTWTIEVQYGELDEGAPPSLGAHAESELGYGGMFAASVASSMSSLSTSSSCSLNSPWSGWGEATPSGSWLSTPRNDDLVCGSSVPSPFILA